MAKHLKNSLRLLIKYPLKWLNQYWQRSIFSKIVTVIVIVIAIAIAGMYGIAEWYIHSQSGTPLTYGVSFVPDYASSLGLNPNQTYDALLNIGVKHFRLTSYWSDIEGTKGQYNFSELDYEFQQAQKYHAKIDLVVGLRQPGWPECHPPSWVNTANPESTWEPQLLNLMTKVVDRYKNSPALGSYQVENEYFLKGFGTCNNMDRSRLVAEYNLVKKLDPSHPIIVTRSNNDIGLPVGKPQPTEFSDSVYLRVWDSAFTHRYLQYPFPSWYFAFMAGMQEILLHKNMMIGELQAEPWAPDGKTIPQISLAEQNKSMNPARLKATFAFAKNTGIKQVYLWGGEYWYYRLTKEHDPDIWNVVKQEFASQANQ